MDSQMETTTITNLKKKKKRSANIQQSAFVTHSLSFFLMRTHAWRCVSAKNKRSWGDDRRPYACIFTELSAEFENVHILLPDIRTSKRSSTHSVSVSLSMRSFNEHGAKTMLCVVFLWFFVCRCCFAFVFPPIFVFCCFSLHSLDLFFSSLGWI